MNYKGMVSFFKKIISKLPVLIYDISAIPISWYLAFWLHHNMHSFPSKFATSYSLLALSILSIIQLMCYYHFKIYRGLWRFASLNDVIRILKSTIYASILVIPVLHFTFLLYHIPYSILPLYGLLLTTMLCSGRLFLRNYYAMENTRKHHADVFVGTIKRVLIIGAGQAGESLIRDLKRTPSYKPIGLLDDNGNKIGLEIHGVMVLGAVAKLDFFVKKYQINLIFIAIPSARSIEMRRIVYQCERCNIPFRTLPGLAALASGHVAINALREVRIDDLLGRDQVEINWDKIAININKKRVLVTGGGGSIGSELCRQIIKLNPSKLLILDNSEFNLYKIEMELNDLAIEIEIEIALINIADSAALNHVFEKFKPQIVFHAAAYKQVPMLENHARTAIQNNIIGTQFVAQASVAVASEKFILISTDKAVNPSSIMGASKRVAEIYCQNFNTHTETKFITVRFGNVLGSVGSVVPLFQAQLQRGGPLTVTHPEIQRYFMTIAEASQLILQAMVNGDGGEIFVLDMGDPIKINYLAEQMIRLAGKEPGQDIAIRYTGLRPGEKLFEELFHISEQLIETEHEKLFKAQFRVINWDDLNKSLRLLHAACASHQHDELIILLKSLVPEFCYDMSSSLANNPTDRPYHVVT